VSRHKRLQNIQLRDNGFDEESAAKLFEALGCVRTLHGIGFRENGLGPRAAQALARVLSTNLKQGLRTLDVRGNPLGDEGVVALANALKGSDAIGHLNLAATRFGPAGAHALARLLSSEPSLPLKEVDLRYNAIGDEGAIALARVIEFHDTLEVLFVNDPSISDEGHTALRRAAAAHGDLHVVESPKELKEEL